jgi:hypothetical protein
MCPKTLGLWFSHSVRDQVSRIKRTINISFVSFDIYAFR